MTMLDNQPAGPQLRPERTEADKIVISAAVREVDTTVSARFALDMKSAPALKKTRTVNRRAAVIAVSAAALLLAIAIVAAPALRQPGSAKGRVANSRHQLSGVSTWRLVSDLSPSWRTLPNSSFEPEGIPAVTFDCPTATTCYAGNFAPSGSGTAVEIEVTDDSGTSWRPSTLPITLSRLPSLFCVDADTCAILGIDGSGDSTFLDTTDGGQTWSTYAGPGELTPIVGPIQLTCKTATSCLAVAARPSQSVGQVETAYAYITDDGGKTWSTSSLPSGFFPSALQCTSLGTCVASGFQSPNEGPEMSGGKILFTTDGGSSWTAAAVPSGLSAFNSLSCADTGRCLAVFSGVGGSPTHVLSTTDGGKTWAVAGAGGFLANGVVMSLSCPDATDCWATGVAGQTTVTGRPEAIDLHTASGFAGSTSDSAETWQEAQLPQGVGALLDISCPNASHCYAVGLKQVQESTNTPQPFVLLAYGNSQ